MWGSTTNKDFNIWLFEKIFSRIIVYPTRDATRSRGACRDQTFARFSQESHCGATFYKSIFHFFHHSIFLWSIYSSLYFLLLFYERALKRALMCVCKQIRQILPHAYHCHVLGQDGHATTTQIDQKRFILIYIFVPPFSKWWVFSSFNVYHLFYKKREILTQLLNPMANCWAEKKYIRRVCNRSILCIAYSRIAHSCIERKRINKAIKHGFWKPYSKLFSFYSLRFDDFFEREKL